MLVRAHGLTCVSRGWSRGLSSNSPRLTLLVRLTDAGEREHAQAANRSISLQAPSFRHQEKAGFIPADGEEMIAGRMGQRSAAGRGRGRADHGNGAARAVEMGKRSHMVVAMEHEFRACPAQHLLKAFGISQITARVRPAYMRRVMDEHDPEAARILAQLEPILPDATKGRVGMADDSPTIATEP
jgi:hypothetical protein